MGRGAIYMLESFPFLLAISTLLGFLSGIGVGGGSLLILWLTLVMNMEQGSARNLNLLFFIPCAVISCIFRWKQGTLNFKEILPAVLFGCISAALFSLLGRNLDTAVLKKLFGGLLLIIGIRELFYRPRKAR